MPSPPPEPTATLAAVPLDRPLRPVPMPSARPWAGSRLDPPGTGERWLAAPDLVVETELGPTTLEALAVAAGDRFLGTAPMALLGPRFPLIVKLIDAGDWLSLQVHPDDALAQELFGPRAVGKTEAWLVLDAAADSRLITGPGSRLGEAALRAAILGGTMAGADCESRAATAGETLLLPAGTMHAIGAGTFVYEIEQPSDITFRISDWERPAAPGRTLHAAESLRAVRADAHAIPAGRDWRLDGGALTVPEFCLEIEEPGAPVTRRPAGVSLEVVTALHGPVRLSGTGWEVDLQPLETAVVPASVPAYRLEAAAGSMACVGSVPVSGSGSGGG